MITDIEANMIELNRLPERLYAEADIYADDGQADDITLRDSRR